MTGFAVEEFQSLLPLSARQPSVHELFERQAERTPEALALVLGEERMSYGTLNARANRLAHHLLNLGVTSGERVAVGADRSMELVVSMLAILKTGGAYLPLDPDSPDDRLRFMLRDGGARIFLTTPASVAREVAVQHRVRIDKGEAFGDLPSTNPGVRTEPDQSAYVCFTSGSMGVPKGVDVLHAGVIRLVRGVEYVRLDATRVVLHAAPPAFDATTFEVWGPLLNGGCVALLAERIPTAKSLRETIARHGVTTAFLTTALVNALVDEDPTALGGLDQLLFGGEAVSVGHVVRLQRACPGVELIHCYGPTETTTFATTHKIASPIDPQQATIPIGRPIANTTVSVLDDDGKPVKAGDVGELFIGGPGVARGYVGRPELTAERFVTHRLDGDGDGDGGGTRLYRTGDMVRVLPGGDLEFVGRRDQQVKIRGHRIELGEIEARLGSNPDVREAVVVCHELQPGDKRLVAHVVMNDGMVLDVMALKRRLRAELPEYMVPQHVVALERFPLTANGKIDRKALPQPDLQVQPRARAHVSPERTVDRQLCLLWGTLLGLDAVGVEDNFFELGGNSLLVIRLLAQIRATYAVDVSVAMFFARPTIAALALVIEARLYLRSGEEQLHQPGGAREDSWL